MSRILIMGCPADSLSMDQTIAKIEGYIKDSKNCQHVVVNGYYSEDEEPEIAKMIRDSRADMLFVGFSSPMKENFLKKWMAVIQVPFCMGVGGSFDIVAGKTKRAPLWMQKSGLEWIYRIYQEPRRMWKRYAKTNPVFIGMVLKEYFRLKTTTG